MKSQTKHSDRDNNIKQHNSKELFKKYTVNIIIL